MASWPPEVIMSSAAARDMPDPVGNRDLTVAGHAPVILGT